MHALVTTARHHAVHVALALWAVRAGRFETGVWAGLRATAIDADRSGSWSVLADAYLAVQRAGDAASAASNAASPPASASAFRSGVPTPAWIMRQ